MTSPSLIDRVRALTGPDREVDRAILDALGIVVREFDPGDGDVSQWREWSDGSKVANTHLTASVDACLALAERRLPGWEWFVGFNPEHECGYAVLSNTVIATPKVSTTGSTPAAALLLAILTADQRSDT